MRHVITMFVGFVTIGAVVGLICGLYLLIQHAWYVVIGACSLLLFYTVGSVVLSELYDRYGSMESDDVNLLDFPI